MRFEAYRISENNYQIYQYNETFQHMKLWLASFNSLKELIIYYINCHNLTGDRIMFTGTAMTDDERMFLEDERREWKMMII